jgi:hypothetical protein
MWLRNNCKKIQENDKVKKISMLAPLGEQRGFRNIEQSWLIAEEVEAVELPRQHLLLHGDVSAVVM